MVGSVKWRVMKPDWVLKTIINIALAALIVLPFGHPSANGQPAARRSSDCAAPVAPPGYFPVFGDFDGDRRLDQAQPHSAGEHQCIRVRFANSLERHLEFGARAHSLGALLALDINHDKKADLIWVNRSRSEPAVVWLGDGLGHFAEGAEWSDDTDLRDLLFGQKDPAVGRDVNDEHGYLAPHAVTSELPRAANLDDGTLKVRSVAGLDRRRDLGLFLSYLRERGPPSFNHFV